MALDALISVSEEKYADLSIDLVRSIYHLEKISQFNQDRDILNSIQRLIDDEIQSGSWGVK